MIITLICFAVIIVGIALVIIGNRVDDWNTSENLKLIGWMVIIISIFASVIAVGFIIGNATACELDYQNFLHEKEILEYRIEHMEENITGNEMLYNDIVEFNNELRSVKKWASNPWTNWFNNQKVASIDYIEFGNT